jgi:tRNA pseudouridine32 synthase/23S rRNA pseudouridine746 synthase
VFDAQQPDGHFKQQERLISQLNDALRQAQSATSTPSKEHLDSLKVRRKQLSEDLQLWLFRQYRMLNARGQEKDLVEIWRSYHASPRLQARFPLPPGGSGDCCAPKLLQYAYLHQLHPLCMAEFWMGESPRGEVRHDGHYYPACRGKCLPILTWMLQGLSVDDDPQLAAATLSAPLTKVYADDDIVVVSKPSGLLTVPGRSTRPSVESILRNEGGFYDGPIIVHRLDQDTSGLLVVARNETAYHHLQQQFIRRQIKKRYIALLDGIVSRREGTISLPLRPDPLDRPRQLVDHEHGKPAITTFEVISTEQGRTRIALTPLTGRTHQLRLHCAHQEGLATPIIGDALYGTPSPTRLCLHAERLSFVHPTTGELLTFELPPDF